ASSSVSSYESVHMRRTHADAQIALPSPTGVVKPHIPDDSIRSGTGESELEFRQRLANRVREARAARGMTRVALAEASDVSLRFLAQIETGHGNPSLLVMRKLAAALSVSVESLVADTVPASVERVLLDRALNQMSSEQIGIVRALIADRF